MAANTMIGLGEFRFSLATAAPQSMDTQHGFSWSEQSVIGKDPSLEYVGNEATIKNLRGTIYPQFRGGLDQVDKMVAMGRKGKPMTLVTAKGVVLGDWVITSVGNVETVFDPTGTAKKIDFTISLKRYSV